MRRILAMGFLAFLTWPGTSVARSPAPIERIPLDETELRLMMNERERKALAEDAESALVQRYHEDTLRLQKRYRLLREPVLAWLDRNGVMAEARLHAFAHRHAESAYGGEAILRLALLQMEEADRAHDRAMERYLQSEQDAQRYPRKDYHVAIATLQKLAEAGESDFRQMARYLIGYAYHEMEEREAAAAAFHELLADERDSEVRAEILVRSGDYFFEEYDTETALDYYAEAMQAGGPWFDRAKYKWAWALYRLDLYPEAIRAFTALADLGQERPDLLEESMQYLAISYVEGMGLHVALEHIASRGSRDYDYELYERIAGVLYDSTEFDSAVEAYGALLELRPLEARNPVIAERRIQALQLQRRIEEAVLARREFFEAFAQGGAWYSANREDERMIRRADKLSERYLYEYATYHHFRLLRGAEGSAIWAEEGYRIYLDRFSGNPRAVQMAFYLADMLYDRGAYDEALNYYTRVALSAPDPASDIASRAAYNMVLAARELYRADGRNLDRLVEVSRRFADMRPYDERTPLVLYHAGRLLCVNDQDPEHARCRDELARMIELYPESDLVVEAMHTVIDSFGAEKRYGELADWADTMMQRGIPAEPRARDYVNHIVGAALFHEAFARARDGDEVEAAKRYLRVYERYTETEAGQAALFNAAYAFEKARDYPRALGHYERLLRRHAESEHAARAAFRKGHILETVFDYPAAVAAYQKVFEQYAEADEAADAMFNAAVLEASQTRHRQAAVLFQRHFDTYGSSMTEPGDALLRAAAQWELGGDDAAARDAFAAFTNLPYLLPRSGYAAYRAALLSSGETRTAWLHQAVAFSRRQAEEFGDTDRSVEAAALFELAEAVREEYRGLGLPSNVQRLAGALNRKAELLQEAEAAYTEVVGTGDAHYGIAALYRIGEAYLHFADTLFEAPEPQGLDEMELEIYRIELEERAAPLEERALETYTRAERRAAQLGVENVWLARIRLALQKQPSTVDLLTANLEPAFAPSSKGAPPPLALALAEPAGPDEDAPVAAWRGQGGVDEHRIDNLLLQSVARQRIFFHGEAAHVDRVRAGKQAGGQ